jgi:hypothetical protein
VVTRSLPVSTTRERMWRLDFPRTKKKTGIREGQDRTGESELQPETHTQEQVMTSVKRANTGRQLWTLSL